MWVIVLGCAVGVALFPVGWVCGRAMALDRLESELDRWLTRAVAAEGLVHRQEHELVRLRAIANAAAAGVPVALPHPARLVS